MTAVLPTTCTHTPPCPSADAPDHDAARIVASHPEQGWYLLCGGIIRFADTGELIPDPTEPCGCHVEEPHRGPAPHRTDQTGGEACPCENEEN